MRILLETLTPPPQAKLCTGAEGDNETLSKLDIQNWDKAKQQPKARDSIINRLIKSYPQNEKILNRLKPVLTQSCVTYGLEPDVNKFLALVASPDMKTCFNPGHYEVLYTMWDKEDINLTLDYLANPSLYARNAKEFRYTVNLFDTVSNPNKIKKFFKNTSGINQNALFEINSKSSTVVGDKGDGVKLMAKTADAKKDKIKPVGTPKSDTSTLAGTVESWSKDGKNDAQDDKEEKAKKAVATDKDSVIDAVKTAIDNKVVTKMDIQKVIR